MRLLLRGTNSRLPIVRMSFVPFLPPIARGLRLRSGGCDMRGEETLVLPSIPPESRGSPTGASLTTR